MIIEYYSNNSNGIDWLTAEDWERLKLSGWKLNSYESFAFDKNGSHKKDSDGCPTAVKEVTHPRYAYKSFDTLYKAIGEWERVTGKSSYETGCETCGDPHQFSIFEQE